MCAPALPFCLCVFCFFYSMYPGFYLAGSPQAHHASDVGRSFVSMLELSCPPAYPIWLLQSLIIVQICECLIFGWPASFVLVFVFSLFVRGIYMHVCLCWPCLTAPIFYCYFVNTVVHLASGKSTMLSPSGEFNTPTWRKPEGCHLSQRKNMKAIRAERWNVVSLWSGV